MVVSSAKILIKDLHRLSGRSLMNNKKRVGLRTDPWGTSALISKEIWFLPIYNNPHLSTQEERLKSGIKFPCYSVTSKLAKKTLVPNLIECLGDIKCNKTEIERRIQSFNDSMWYNSQNIRSRPRWSKFILDITKKTVCIEILHDMPVESRLKKFTYNGKKINWPIFGWIRALTRTLENHTHTVFHDAGNIFSFTQRLNRFARMGKIPERYSSRQLQVFHLDPWL